MTPLRSWTFALFVATVLLPASNSFAQFGRGGYQMRFWQQGMQAMQKQQQATAKQQQDEQDAFMKRFDTNKNGKIDGKEKGPAQKYLRSLEMGKDPDKAIKSLGRPTSSSGATRTKRSSTK